MATVPEKNNSPKKRLDNYFKYSAVGIQMAAVIFLLTWAGVKLDDYFSLKFPAFTLILSFISVIAAIYYLIKETKPGK